MISGSPMRRFNACHIRIVAVGFTIASCLSTPLTSSACLAHYFSPEALVARSPLIFIGEVESVGVPSPEKKGPEETDDEYQIRVVKYDDPTKPPLTEADVRISKVLMGEYTASHIRIQSGPIRSCAPYNIYLSFTVGQRSIFLLQSYPKEGRTQLFFDGSIRPLSDRELIESRIAHFNNYVNDYLSEMENNFPRLYRNAKRLFNRMRGSGVRPIREECPKIGNLRKLLSQFGNDAFKIFETVSALGRRLEPQREIWLNNACASYLSSTVTENQGNKRAALFQRVSTDLSKLGMKQALIDEYLAEINVDSFEAAFPVRVPELNVSAVNGSVRTTHLIYRYYSYDRGAIFVDYGLNLDASAGLNAGRLKTVIPAMLGSADRNLAFIAAEAVKRIPGQTFAPHRDRASH